MVFEGDSWKNPSGEDDERKALIEDFECELLFSTRELTIALIRSGIGIDLAVRHAKKHSLDLVRWAKEVASSEFDT